MTQNGQIHFEILAANAVSFLKFIWPFRNIMVEKLKVTSATKR